MSISAEMMMMKLFFRSLGMYRNLTKSHTQHAIQPSFHYNFQEYDVVMSHFLSVLRVIQKKKL